MENESNPQNQISIQPGLFLRLKFFLAKEKIVIIAILIMCIISFSAAGFLLASNKKKPIVNNPLLGGVIFRPSLTPSPAPTAFDAPPIATSAPTLTADETATWSAFASQKYFYSIKYPTNWTAQITSQSDPKILEYVVFNPVATKAGTLSITLSYGTRTYLEALALDSQIGEAIMVASVSATKKSSKDSNGYQAINIIVPAASSSIVFNAKKVYENLFNQMLTTLKLAK